MPMYRSLSERAEERRQACEQTGTVIDSHYTAAAVEQLVRDGSEPFKSAKADCEAS